jgi:hypothetical protein
MRTSYTLVKKSESSTILQSSCNRLPRPKPRVIGAGLPMHKLRFNELIMKITAGWQLYSDPMLSFQGVVLELRQFTYM